MAKLLTCIWKTAKGLFVETEEEALRLERIDDMRSILNEARDVCLKDAIAQYREAQERYNTADSLYRTRGGVNREYPPIDPRRSYIIPPGMAEEVLKQLEASGHLAPLKLTGGLSG